MTKYSIKPGEIRMEGHARNSAQDGIDANIVCAALSTLKKMLLDGLLMAGTGFIYDEHPETASFWCHVTLPVNDAGHFVLMLFEREMAELESAAPEYVKRTD